MLYSILRFRSYARNPANAALKLKQARKDEGDQRLTTRGFISFAMHMQCLKIAQHVEYPASQKQYFWNGPVMSLTLTVKADPDCGDCSTPIMGFVMGFLWLR